MIQSEELTFRVDPRPIRMVFVVRTRDEILMAVRLYTHVCGGAAGVILPLPNNQGEESLFEYAILNCDPDVIFTAHEEVMTHVADLLRDRPYAVTVLGDEELTEHCEGINPLLLTLGRVPHVLTLLQEIHPDGLSDSTIRVVSPSDSFAFELALHNGMPGDRYRSALSSRWGAKRFRPPVGVAQLVQVLLTTASRATPVSTTIGGLGLRAPSVIGRDGGTPLTDIRSRSDQSLFLFLDDGDDPHTPAAFWNSRRVSGRGNKYLLPREAFLADLETCLHLLRLDRAMAELIVFTRSTGEEAQVLHTRLSDAVSRGGKGVPVAVYHAHYGYEVERGGAYARGSETMTRAIRPDGSVRFSVVAPNWAGRSSVFGYDASVEYASGVRLALPRSVVSTVLLLNEPDRIRRAEENEKGLGNLWLRSAPLVRTREGGIAGVTMPGQELSFFLHEDEFFIQRVLRQRGFRVQPNRHTRYAQGFIRKFGGFDKAMRLIGAGGAHILGALDQHRAEQCGLGEQQITAYMQRQKKVNGEIARKTVETCLPELLASGIIRRGIALECPHCHMRDWYPLDTLREFIECMGCAEAFQLPRRGLAYQYRANELARRLIHEGGHAVLQAAAVLRSMEPAGVLQFGGDVFRGDERINGAELDLLMLSNDILAIAECKAWNKLDESGLVEVVASLRRLVALAPDIGAAVVFLSVVTDEAPAELYAAVQNISEQAASQNVAVHLAVGSDLFINGETTPTVSPGLRFEHLTVDKPSEAEATHVGALSSSIGIGSFRRAPRAETVAGWELELLAD